MCRKVMAVSIVTALIAMAMIYTSPSVDSIIESQPPELTIAPDNNIIIFPKGGGYDDSYWLRIHSEYSVVETSINLIGLDALDSVQPGLSSLVSSETADDISTDPQVVTDIYNNHYVAWIDTGGIVGAEEGTDVFIKYWDSQSYSWKGLTQLSDNDPKTNAKDPAIATDTSGNIYVVWAEDGSGLPDAGGPDYDIFYRTWDGNTWGATQLISDDANDGISSSPEIAVDPYGNIHIIWADTGNIESSGTDSDIVYKFYNGTTWSSTFVLSDDINDGDSIEPAIACRDTYTYFAWSDSGDIISSGTDYDIILRTSKSGALGGTFLVSFDQNDGESHNPDLAAFDDKLCIAWQDDGDIKNSGTDSDIIYTCYDRSINQFDDIHIVTDNTSFGSSVQPDIVLDTHNNIYIAWADYGNALSSGSDWDIFYRVLDKQNVREPVLLTDDSLGGISINVSLALNFQNNHIQFVWEETANLLGGGTDEDIYIKDLHFNYQYPTNLEMDIGIEGNSEWKHFGILNGSEEVGGEWLGLKLTSLVEQGKETAVSGYVEIPIRFTSDSTGALNISKVSLRGTATPKAPENLTILNEDLLHVLNHKPVFGWDFIDIDSDCQGRFEVRIGTTPGGNDIWDPVPKESENTSVAYPDSLSTLLIDGETYYFQVRVTDCDGSVWSDWSEPLEFRMNTAPYITSFTPDSGIFDEKIKLSWSGSDAENDSLTYYILALYDGFWHVIVDGSILTSYTWETENLNEQDIGFYCYANDGFENSSNYYTSGDIYIGHNTPPTLRITSPSLKEKLRENTYVITWTSTDLDDDVLSISLFYDEDNDSAEKNLIVENHSNEDETEWGEYEWDTSSVPDGEYYILGIITDGTENVEAYSEGTVEIGLDPELLPPAVVSWKPEGGKDRYNTSIEITVTLSKTIDQSTINEDTFYVKGSNGIIVDGSRIFEPLALSIRFIPDNDLDYDTAYTVVLTNKIMDNDGLFLDGNNNGLDGEGSDDDFSWTFTTVKDDLLPPFVRSTEPSIDAVDIDINTNIKINFSEKIEPTTLNDRSFLVISLDSILAWDGVSIDWLISNSVLGDPSYIFDNRQAIFNPREPLEYNTTYVVILMPEITDLAGNSLAGNYELRTIRDVVYPYVFSFTTALEINDTGADSDSEKENVIVEVFQWEYFYYLFVILLIVIILVITAIIRQRILLGPISIKDVFIIYNDGRLLHHFRPKQDGMIGETRPADIDESAVSSMLTAIQDFVKESFKYSRGSGLNELRHGLLRILIEHGKYSYVAVVCSGGPTSKIREEMKSIIYDLDVKYGPVLKEWDGNMNSIAGIDKLIVPLVMLEKDAQLEDD